MTIVEEVCANLLTARYTFAKTMPENPHFYTKRAWWIDDEAFTIAAREVQARGEKYWFGGHFYQQFHANGYTWWTMGASPQSTTIINRKRRLYDAAFDEIAHEYSSAKLDSWEMAQNREIGDLIGTVDNRTSVLDLGCGAGFYHEVAQGPVLPEQYVGIDVSGEMLKAHSAQHPRFMGSLVQCSIEEYYPQRKFDLVLALNGSGVLMSDEDIKRYVRCLGPGGKAVIMTWHPSEGGRLYDRWGITMPHNKKGYSLLSSLTIPYRIGHHEVYVLEEGMGQRTLFG